MCLLIVDRKPLSFFFYLYFVIYWIRSVGEQNRRRAFGNELLWRMFECNGAIEEGGY